MSIFRRVTGLTFAFGLGAALASCGGASSPEPDASIFPDSIRAELIALGNADQEPRLALTPERMEDTVFLRSLLGGDSARTARLRSLVEQHGWPTPARAGDEAAHAAFLILQHSPDAAFRRDWVGPLEELARSGAMPRDDVAMLVDHVLQEEGLPQRYGTQFTLVEGVWVMYPVEDEAGLEERRSSMGLPPMETYMEQMEAVYGAPVVRRRP